MGGSCCRAKRDDVVDGEEVRRVTELGDEGQFLGEALLHLVGNPLRIALACALPGEMLELRLRRPARRDGLFGIFVAQLVEREAAGRRDLQRIGDGLRMVAEQPGHFLRRLEMALGIGLEPVARRGHGDALADGGDHVLQHAARGMVVEHVIGGEQRHLVTLRQLGKAVEPGTVVAAVEMAGGEIERRLEPRLHLCQVIGAAGQQREDEALGEVADIVERQQALALAGAALAEAEQPAQAAIGGARGGPGQQRKAVEIEPGAHHEGQLRILRGTMRAHHPGQRVAVGDGQRGQSQMLGLHRQLLGVRGAAQEGEVAGALQLGVAHDDNPCTNHFGCDPPVSP